MLFIYYLNNKNKEKLIKCYILNKQNNLKLLHLQVRSDKEL